MNERIKKIRKDNSLTQKEFGESIGIKANTVTNYENGLRVPSNAVIASICREFNVNEKWLKTGDGEPYVKRTRNQEIAFLINSIMADQDESFRKRFIASICKLDKEDWEYLEKLWDKMAGDK